MKNFAFIETFYQYSPVNLEFLKDLVPESFGKYIDFLPIFLLAMLFAFVVTPIIGHIAKKYKIMDYPYKERKVKLNKDDDPKRHIHLKATPLLGGLSYVIPVIITLLLFWDVSLEIKAVLVGVLILVIVGILDDIFNLPAIYQLLGQLAAGLVICLSPISLLSINIPLDGIVYLNWFETSFSLLGIPLMLVFPGDFLILLWILICINAIKFVNGSDGLMEGNAIIICLLFFVLGIRTEAEIIIILSLILAGGLTGFLFYNFPPARIFSGSAGTTTLGFLIAVIAIINNTKFAASIMILTLPMIDFFFVIAKRYFTLRPKRFLDVIRINDTNHLHHQLINLGFNSKKILLIEVGITLAIGLIAILTTGAMHLFFFFFLIFMVIVIILTLHMIVSSRKSLEDNDQEKNEKESPESRYSY
jgi:UDP-GlcNAc:undecaprenyl-phosphate/decaprenyl-phosphate GlcNAc-1-phosphate transferase